MALTISDIAAQAGVSKATVSRVLNNRPEGVGAETRTRIETIVRETGFQRSAVARRLATGRSRTVGLIIPDIANPFYPLLVRGLERALSQSGYSLLLCNSDRSLEKESDYVRILLENGVDGVILDSAAADCDGQLRSLGYKGVPCGLLGRGAHATVYSSITGTAPGRQRLICFRAAGARCYSSTARPICRNPGSGWQAWTMRCGKAACRNRPCMS